MAGLPALRQTARELQSYGRNGDTLLAHITPQEASLLRRLGGAGTRNPVTGLPEFYDADGNGNATDSSNPTGGDGAGVGGGFSVDSMMDMSQPAPAITEEVDVTTHPSHVTAAPVGAPVEQSLMGFVQNAIQQSMLGQVWGAAQQAGLAPGFMGLGPGLGLVNATMAGLNNPQAKSLDQVMTEQQGFGLVNSMIGGPVGAIGMGLTGLATAAFGPPTGPAETAEQSSQAPNNAAGGASGNEAVSQVTALQRFMAITGRHPREATQEQWAMALRDPIVRQTYGTARMAEGGEVVSSLYRELFGRDPDNEGRNYWESELAAGRSTADSLRKNLISGAQGDDRSVAIRNAYRTLFGRDADSEGLGYWLNNYGTMSSDGDLENDLLAGATDADRKAYDYLRQNARNLETIQTPDFANEELVRRLYLQNFGREPDREGMDYWKGQLTKGAVTPDDLDRVMMSGADDADRAAAVSQVYQTAFGRAPDEEGVAYWSDRQRFTNLTSDGDIENDILLGAQAPDRAAAVERLGYQDYFGREADQTGLEYWTGDAYSPAFSGGREGFVTSFLGGATPEDRQAAVDRSIDLLFNRDSTPTEISRYTADDAYNAAIQAGLRPTIAADAYGDDRQRLITNADIGMFNPVRELDKTAGEVFRDLVVNQPEQSGGTSTYMNSLRTWDDVPERSVVAPDGTVEQVGWQNPNVVPDEYFPVEFQARVTGVGDLTGYGETPTNFNSSEIGPPALQAIQNYEAESYAPPSDARVGFVAEPSASEPMSGVMSYSAPSEPLSILDRSFEPQSPAVLPEEDYTVTTYAPPPDARVGLETTLQDLLNERFGVGGQPGDMLFADVSVPPMPGTIGPGMQQAEAPFFATQPSQPYAGDPIEAPNRVVPGDPMGASPIYAPFDPQQSPLPPTPPVINPVTVFPTNTTVQGPTGQGVINYPAPTPIIRPVYRPFTPPNLGPQQPESPVYNPAPVPVFNPTAPTLSYLSAPTYAPPDLERREVGFVDMQGRPIEMRRGGPVMARKGLAALRRY